MKDEIVQKIASGVRIDFNTGNPTMVDRNEMKREIVSETKKDVIKDLKEDEKKRKTLCNLVFYDACESRKESEKKRSREDKVFCANLIKEGFR